MNKLPCYAIAGKSPYEFLFSRASKLSPLKTIGCPYYALVVSKGDKFLERAKPANLIGYFYT